jgi:hypothetical protein
LVSIVADMARMFRPFFTEATAEKERPYQAAAAEKRKKRSPSNIVRTAERHRLCG